MNTKGKMTMGSVILIVALVLGAYMFVPSVKDTIDGILGGEDKTPIGSCPSSGLTEVTLNTVDALADNATDVNVTYFVYENGKLLEHGETGADGTVSFDVECGVGRTLKGIVFNEVTDTGYYAKEFTIDATSPTDTANLALYQYGGINFVSVASDVDPSGTSNVSGGDGKQCGIVATFTVNESASAYAKPLLICEGNTTSIDNIKWNGVTRVDNKRPNRLSTLTGRTFWTWELDETILSTDPAKKITGSITFQDDPGGELENNLTCTILDQATFRGASYKTMSLSEGMITAAEDENNADVGGGDSNDANLYFVHASGYC